MKDSSKVQYREQTVSKELTKAQYKAKKRILDEEFDEDLLDYYEDTI